jgi:hypothetical protein
MHAVLGCKCFIGVSHQLQVGTGRRTHFLYLSSLPPLEITPLTNKLERTITPLTNKLENHLASHLIVLFQGHGKL